MQVVFILLLIPHYLLYPYGRYLVGMYSNSWNSCHNSKHVNTSWVDGFLRTVGNDKQGCVHVGSDTKPTHTVLDITHNNEQ